jgi:hypothetical protein
MAMGMLLSPKAQAVQCVTYAREMSGIGLKGDAWTWWISAAGQYERGQKPRPGAVVVFKKHGSMRHGHVAVVTEIVNSRKVLVDHANWAPQRGHGRGQVSTRVMMMDVSPRNDWTQVRVWHEASGELGQRVYPTYGFIYAKAPRSRAEAARPAPAPAAAPELDFATDIIHGAPLGMPDLATSLANSSLLPAEPAFAQ